MKINPEINSIVVSAIWLGIKIYIVILLIGSGAPTQILYQNF